MAIENKKMQQRRGTSGQWLGVVLQAGEIGLDTTLGVIRVGDGFTAYENLPILTTISPDALNTTVNPDSGPMFPNTVTFTGRAGNLNKLNMFRITITNYTDSGLADTLVASFEMDTQTSWDAGGPDLVELRAKHLGHCRSYVSGQTPESGVLEEIGRADNGSGTAAITFGMDAVNQGTQTTFTIWCQFNVGNNFFVVSSLSNILAVFKQFTTVESLA